jgi:hypothetical protein
MGTELPTKVMLGQTLVLMQMTFLNNVRKVGRSVLSRTSCLCTDLCTETLSSSCYSQLPTVSEPNADTDIVVVHTISEDKKIDKMQVLEEDHLSETINVNNLTTLVTEYPSDKSNFSETLTSADKTLIINAGPCRTNGPFPKK